MGVLYFILYFLQPICLPVPELGTVLWGSGKLGSMPAFILGTLGTLAGILFMYVLSKHLMVYLEKKKTIQNKIRQFPEQSCPH